MLVFVFGSTTFASSTVLAVFMGGLALGAFMAGKVADRLKRPFLWYGILEGIIGIWALLSPFLFDAAIPIYKVIWQQFHLSAIPFSLIRFMVAACILLPPTTCMGATLPILSRFVTVSLSTVGDRVGTLYAVNTLGAVVGAVTAGFLLLPNLGLSVTTLIAIGTNLLLLAIVLVASKKVETGGVLEMLPKEAEQHEGLRVALPPPVVAAMVAFGFSGAIAMVYEVAWTRSLLMVIGSSTYAFSVMLSTFLIGIFLGSFICARFVDKSNRPLAWLALAQFLVCAGGLLSVYLFNYVPYWNVSINAGLHENANASLLVRFLLAGSVLIPITVCLGAIFPLVVKACTNSLESVGRSVGTIYSANTLGAIIGAFLAGFVIIPMIGAERALIYSSVSNFVIAAVLAWYSDLLPRVKYATIAGAAAAVLIVAIGQKPVWDPVALMNAQGERRLETVSSATMQIPPFEEWLSDLHKKRELLYWEDGACATVGVIRHGLTNTRSLLTNGHIDASDARDMSNQVLIAGYPLFFHPEAKSAAIVGWGSAVTTGTAAAYPNLKRVVSIEIEPAVMRAAHFFDHVNLRPDLNPSSMIEVNDARNYLVATNEKFDAVISEPSNPWQAGVCNLFTKEFFKIAHERMAPHGIFCGWLQFQEVAPKDVMHVLSALRTQFKYMVPLVSSGCLMVLASDEPIHFDPDKANAVLHSNPHLTALMRRIGVDSIADVLACVVCTDDVVDKLIAGVTPNSDDRNFLEFDVGKTYENKAFQLENEALLNKSPGEPWKVVEWGNRTAEQKTQLMNEVAQAALAIRCNERALAWAKESYKTSPNSGSIAIQAMVADAQGNLALSQKLFEESTTMNPADPKPLMTRAGFNLSKARYAQARADLTKLAPNDIEAQYLLAKTYTKVGSPTVIGAKETVEDSPLKVLQTLSSLPPDFVRTHPDVLLMTGMANMRLKDFDRAEHDLRAYIATNPQTIVGWRALGTVLFEQGEEFAAAECWRRGLASAQAQSTSEVSQALRFTQDRHLDHAFTVLHHALELDPGNQAGRELLAQLARAGMPEARALMDKIAQVK